MIGKLFKRIRELEKSDVKRVEPRFSDEQIRINLLEKKVKYLEKRVKRLEEQYRRLFDIRRW